MHRLLASAAVVLSLFASHAHAAFNPSHAFVTPQMFGAVGDDSHDDTAALQAWLTATVGTCGSQQAPFWTRGTYKISSTLTVTSLSMRSSQPIHGWGKSCRVGCDSGW